MRHFDLKKALAGAPLVTRGGLKVTKFSTTNNPKFFNVTLENGKKITVEEQGIAAKSENDLLLVAPRRALDADVLRVCRAGVERRDGVRGDL